MNNRANAIGREYDAPGRVRIKGPLRQNQIAALHGCTEQNIQNIEGRAIKKLRLLALRTPELADAMRKLFSE